jgi:hypothetical protein
MLTPEALLPRIESLRNEAVEARNDLRVLYAGLTNDDPRVVVARHIKAVISSSYLSLIHLHENLQEPLWWHRQGFGAAVQAGTVLDELDDYMVLITANLIIYPFSLFEAGLRRIVRALDPSACSGGAAEFKGIYEWLLARLRGTGWKPSEAGDFLDLYRNVRNTLHNNGRYYSRTGANTAVTWKGTTYEFVHSSVPSFMNWDFDLMLIRELVRLNRDLMKAPLIRSIGQIQ